MWPDSMRLAQHLEHAAVELRQLVEEQHAVVGERDLARPRPRRRRRPAPSRTRCGAGCGTAAAAILDAEAAPGERSHRRGLERLVLRHRRAGSRAGAGPACSCPSRAGRSSAGCARPRRRSRARGAPAPGRARRRGRGTARRASPSRGAPRPAAAACRAHIRTPRAGARRRARARAARAPPRRGCPRERSCACPARMPCSAVGSTPRIGCSSPPSDSSPYSSVASNGPGGSCVRGDEDADGDRQVEAAALLRQVRRREVDGDVPGRQLEAAVGERRAHAVLALLHDGLGEPRRSRTPAARSPRGPRRAPAPPRGPAGCGSGWSRNSRALSGDLEASACVQAPPAHQHGKLPDSRRKSFARMPPP